MEAIRSSETSVDTRTTRHHIPENGILQYKAVSKRNDQILETAKHNTRKSNNKKLMETLRYGGIEFVLPISKEFQLATLRVLPFVYTL
jgi:hypothetical protein